MRFVLSNKNIRVRVAALIIRDQEILLIAHKKKNNIYWLLPGGGVELNESLDEALKRELFEELGLNVEVGDIAMIADSIEPYGKRHIINIVFWCNMGNQQMRLGDDRVLHSYSFKPVHELNTIVMHPPLNTHIQDLIYNKNKRIYKGSLWIP